MSVSAIDKELEYYVSQLDDPQKKSLLNMIKSFISLENEGMGYVTMEEYNQELAEAEAEYERGEYITNDEMKRQIEQWQKKATL